MNSNKLTERLSTTLLNIEKLITQLRDTKDYSEKAEVYFLLHELILEQTVQQNENTGYTTHQSR